MATGIVLGDETNIKVSFPGLTDTYDPIWSARMSASWITDDEFPE